MKNFLPLLVLFFSVSCFSQIVEKADNIYDITGIDVKPEFPEGTERFNAYIVDILQKNGFKPTSKTKIAVLFVIEKDGSLTDIKIIGRADPLIAKELVESVKDLPRWNPGVLKGEAVRTLKAHPIVFR